MMLKNLNNIPEVRVGVIAVSRDCFPIELSRKRRKNVVNACAQHDIGVVEVAKIIENESDIDIAIDEIRRKQINALVIYLGNFGPEGPLTILAKKFTDDLKGPVMLCAAAEETQEDLIDGRGDAYCGLLSACYNLKLRNVNAYIPHYPVGVPEDIAGMIKDFIPISRVYLGVKNLKIITFGPRPQDFFACNAPIKPLYDLGIEIMENSELDLYDLFLKAEDNPQIERVKAEMEKELGDGNKFPEILDKLARYEVALTEFYHENLGSRQFGVFAIKCWPAFQHYFGFTPCYVNGRLAARGIPVACEVDIYGALSEYIGALASKSIPTILDINNSVPRDMYKKNSDLLSGYKPSDLFMGFHCGNTAVDCMKSANMNYQLIMHRLLEPDQEPDITRGTVEGQLKPGDTTIYRLQSSAEGQLRAYVAEGEILDIDPRSFGGIGVIGIEEMGRFYRYALLEKQFPHHTAALFEHKGKIIFEALKLLGIYDISTNQPQDKMYEKENPF